MYTYSYASRSSACMTHTRTGVSGLLDSVTEKETRHRKGSALNGHRPDSHAVFAKVVPECIHCECCRHQHDLQPFPRVPPREKFYTHTHTHTHTHNLLRTRISHTWSRVAHFIHKLTRCLSRQRTGHCCQKKIVVTAALVYFIDHHVGDLRKVAIR